jgi:hypothetical protein
MTLPAALPGAAVKKRINLFFACARDPMALYHIQAFSMELFLHQTCIARGDIKCNLHDFQ